MFLSIPFGGGHHRAGHFLVAVDVGEVGDRGPGRDPGHYEPFLPVLLLPGREKNLRRSRESLSPKSTADILFPDKGIVWIFL